MGALSRKSIINRLRNGNLFLSPIIGKEQLGSSSIDLRMGTMVLLARAGGQSHVDPQSYQKKLPTDDEIDDDHDSVRNKEQKHERFDVPFHRSFLLHPGKLALVPTLEWIKVPNDLQGIVTARSSWAREGLSIATATIIDPGYTGIITLELANLGEVPMKLYPGLRLAQIAFYTLDDHQSRPNQSKFHLSFEPKGGHIGADEGCFIPSKP